MSSPYLFDLPSTTPHPWPQDAVLFEPTDQQITLPELASCLCTEAVLSICGVDVTIIPRANAEFMAPAAPLVPLIQADGKLYAGFHAIMEYLSRLGRLPSGQFDDPRLRGDVKAFVSLIDSTCSPLEQTLAWLDSENYREITHVKYGSVYSWPLCQVLPWIKRRSITSHLNKLNWTGRDILQEADKLCKVLSDKLGDDEKYLVGGVATEADAVALGHLLALFGSTEPQTFHAINPELRQQNSLGHVLEKYKNLLDYVESKANLYLNTPLPAPDPETGLHLTQSGPISFFTSQSDEADARTERQTTGEDEVGGGDDDEVISGRKVLVTRASSIRLAKVKTR